MDKAWLWRGVHCNENFPSGVKFLCLAALIPTNSVRVGVHVLKVSAATYIWRGYGTAIAVFLS